MKKNDLLHKRFVLILEAVLKAVNRSIEDLNEGPEQREQIKFAFLLVSMLAMVEDDELMEPLFSTKADELKKAVDKVVDIAWQEHFRVDRHKFSNWFARRYNAVQNNFVHNMVLGEMGSNRVGIKNIFELLDFDMGDKSANNFLPH